VTRLPENSATKSYPNDSVRPVPLDDQEAVASGLFDATVKIRLAGLELVSRLHIREGMPLCVSVVELKRWGSDRRLKKGMECLARYGVHAKTVLPELREIRRSLKNNDKNGDLLDKTIAGIEASTDSPTLVNFNDFKTRP